MSFIIKRERVFDDKNLFDLPARNEGKLKAYSSCTDARAWSHFCSDKSDHLVEIIKRNNETCRPKYIPTEVIVDTLMGNKNAEINRLRRRIEEFEQLLAAYDHLELTPEQKNEIANAHAAIKAANKELDDMCLDLDLSGFTEGIDSEAFETGKSRGDEIMRSKDFEMETSRGTERSMDVIPHVDKETKSNQTGGLSCPCDASTDARDPRIEEMQDVIINKDAKMNAMKNTIAVLENDVCEPYCIYAHVITALEKIFAVLCQNEKYKQYLDLMTSGNDLRYVDIKVKIFYKLKVLEKFCGALITPCSKECSCNHTEIVSRVETAFSLTADEGFKVNVDSKRAHLVADIMGNVEMQDILCKNKSSVIDDDISADEDLSINNSSIETQNLNRLKNLQTSYDELLACYEELKYEKDCVITKCRKYEDLEKEVEVLRKQLNSYNCLINEKEYFRKRSEDLDLLREKCLVLADETSNLERQYQAQVEINNVKSATVEQLRIENTTLQRKLNDASTMFEKEKHALICKLSECECKIICQNQQIESLSAQINAYIKGMETNVCGHDESERETEELLDQIISLKGEIQNLKTSLYNKDEEANQIRDESQGIINTLKLEIEHWKRFCEEAIQRNDYLEKIAEKSQGDFEKVIDENQKLFDEVQTKSKEIEELRKDNNDKSLELNKLTDMIESKSMENRNLLNRINTITNDYGNKVNLLEREKEESLNSINLASHESDLLLGKKSYDDLEQEPADVREVKEEYGESTKGSIDENEPLVLESQSNNSFNLINEIDKFRVTNTDNIKKILAQNQESLQNLEEKENEISQSKYQIEKLKEEIDKLNKLNESILEEKQYLLNELEYKSNALIEADNQNQVLQNQNEKLKEDVLNIKDHSDLIIEEKNNLKNEVLLKCKEVQDLKNLIESLQNEKQTFSVITESNKTLEQRIGKLRYDYDNLIHERDRIQDQVALQADEIVNLQSTLEEITEHNNKFLLQIKTLQEQRLLIQNKVNSLECENLRLTTSLNDAKSENDVLRNKIEVQEMVDGELSEMKSSFNKLKFEKENLEKDLQTQSALVSSLGKENKELQETNTNLIAYNNDIENALIRTRDELHLEQSSPSDLLGNIKEEMKEIKNKNEMNQKEIQNLLEELANSDKLVAKLCEDISIRDEKISILENKVNELGDEIKMLQKNLATMIDLGEEMDYRNQEIDNSLKQMEAHHSKATHNMKIKLRKLKDQNNKLEEQLSATKIDIEVSSEENLARLNDEREIIVTDIKQLEIRCVGDSALSPDNCGVKSIISSLERISNYIDLQEENANKDSKRNKIIIERKTEELKTKYKVITDLENMLAALKNKKLNDFQVQADIRQDVAHNLTQTENLDTEKDHDNDDHIYEDNNKKGFSKNDRLPIISMEVIKDPESDKISNDVIPNKNPPTNNEVQILTANLEPGLGFARNAYLHDKLKKLSVGGMKICSVSYISEDDTSNSEVKESREESENYEMQILDGDLSKEEDKKSKQGEMNINDQSSNWKTKNEINKSQFNFESSTFANKKDDEVPIASSKVDKSSNTFITIFRSSDYDESGVDIIQNKEKEYFDSSSRESERNKTVVKNVSEVTDSAKLNDRKSLNNDKMHDKAKNNLVTVHRLQTNHSISETSLLNNSRNKDTKMKPSQETNEYYKLNMQNRNRISSSLKSLISNEDCAKLMEYSNENIPQKVFDTISKNKIDIYIPRQDNLTSYNNNTSGNKKDNVLDKFMKQQNEKDIVKTNIFTRKKLDGLQQTKAVLLGKKNDVTSLNKKVPNTFNTLQRSKSNVSFHHQPTQSNTASLTRHPSFHMNLPKDSKLSSGNKNINSTSKVKAKDVAVMAKIDTSNEKIKFLTSTLENVDRDYKLKIRAIKAQYDYNIKKIMNEHNQGVQSLQSLHEETLQDILKVHENETENLRTMSIDAMRKVDKLEKENNALKAKVRTTNQENLDEEPTKISSTEIRSRGSKYGSRADIKTLTKTNIEEFSNNPNLKTYGLCTCSPDVNVSDTIRNIFEQMDVDQRRMAEQAYLKYIANKIMVGSIEALDVQELSFLHSKICRIWKTILRKEEVLNSRIDSLETELVNKQRQTQNHIAELDRKVAKERRRLQEVREAVCRDLSADGSNNGPHTSRVPLEPDAFENLFSRNLISSCTIDERLPAGDVSRELTSAEIDYRRVNRETNKVQVLPGKVDSEDRREKKAYSDERPTRLRRSTDRPRSTRSRKK